MITNINRRLKEILEIYPPKAAIKFSTNSPGRRTIVVGHTILKTNRPNAK
jgi:hypothetical protein